MIDQLHDTIYNLVNGTNLFNIGFYEKPKELTDHKLPAFCVYFIRHDNTIISGASNKRTLNFGIDIIYDRDDLPTTQRVTSSIVESVIDVLEARANRKMGGYADYVLPTSCERVDPYLVAGKNCFGYTIILPVIKVTDGVC